MPNWNHIVREHLAVLRLPPEREVEIVEEQALHLEAAYEDALADGLSAAESEARALRSYDWRLLECELSRAELPLAARALQPSLELLEHKGGMRMESFIRDLRFGARMLLKNPGFTLIAALTLALGIGANTAIFSVVNAVLLRPLPYPASVNLVEVCEGDPKGSERNNFSLANFIDYRDQQTSFEQMAAYFRRDANMLFAGEPERLLGASVSPNFFQLLRVQPMLGRGFLAEEGTPGKHRVALLSHSLWQRRFGANPDIINKPVTLGAAAYTVVGVLPPDFQFPDPQGVNQLSDSAPRVELVTPLAYDQKNLGDRGSRFMRVIARLKPGVGLAQAQTELRAIAGRLERQYPERNQGWTVNVFALHDEVVRVIRPSLLLLLAAVSFVLLIGCVNVSNLLLARAASRRKEMAIRLALGVTRGRLLRQLLTESLLLAGLGAAAGLTLAYWMVRAFITLSPANVPRADEIRLDNVALLFTCGVSLLASVIFGLLPALAASHPEVQEAIKEGGRNAGARRWRARSLLVVSEVALSLLLLIGAGLMIRTFLSLQRVNPGFRTNNLLTMRVALPANKYREPQQKAAFFQQVIERTKVLLGVQSAGAVSYLPLGGGVDSLLFIIEDRPATTLLDNPSAAWRSVSVDFFRAMGMQVVRGRAFTEQDKPGAPEPVIINETLARRFWPGEDPIGKRLQVYDGDLLPWREIVGVVNDIKQSGLHAPAMPEIYVPFLQRPWGVMTLIAHTAGAPEQLGAAMRAAVQSVDKEQPVYGIKTMAQYFSDAVAAPRATMFLLSALAGAALLLAAVGIYGVTAYAVTERTREIGIRLALGAQRGEVQRMVIGQGMKLSLLGVGLGLGASLALTRWMETLLFGVLPTDPLTFTLIAVVLTLVALLACWIPARRATKVDPLTALRHE